MSNYFSLVSQLQTLIDGLDKILSGDENETVTVNGTSKDTISKSIKDRFTAIYAIANGHTAYETKSAIDAAGAPTSPSMAFVWNDSGENNGLYGWSGTAWVKSEYDPLSFSFLSESSYASRNAGFDPVTLKYFHSKAGTTLATNLLDPRMVTFTKDVNSAIGLWYGAWIEINYENLDDLNVDFVLDVEHVAGGTFDTFNIVATKADWSPGNYPITIGSSQNGKAVNLYDRIMASSQDNIDYYSGANKLYLIVGDYTASTSANQAATATWRVAARFNRPGKVVASELIQSLKDSLSSDTQSQIDTSVAQVSQPKAVDSGRIIGGVNSFFASVVAQHADHLGDTFAVEATVNTTANSYSYISFKVSDDYNDFINNRYRIFIEADQATSMIVRIGNGNAWGSGDGSVGSFIFDTFQPSEENEFSGYVDVDIPSSSAANFYADPNRVNNQDLFFIIGVDGKVTDADMGVKVSFVNLDDYESQQASIVDTSHPFAVISDKLVKEIPLLINQLNSVSTDVQVLKDSPANSALHAGVKFLPNSDVYAQSYRDITIDGEVGKGGVTATKNVEAATYTWYAVKIAVRYDSIEDLNRNFYLGYEHVSGEVPNTFNFVDGPQDDWNPIHHPIGMGSLSDGVYNIYDKLMADSAENRAAYEAQNVLYINVAVFNPDSSVPPSMESVWKLNPYFELKGSKVVASELSTSLSLSISQEIDQNVEQALVAGQYITCWGDSLTAGGGWTSTLASLSGYPVYNGGTGGENSRTIMARQGGDAMVVNNITIPADTSQVLIADRDVDGGIPTQFGHSVTPLLQGGAHVNPVLIGDIEGTLTWTGSGHSDMTGNWVFSRSEAGSEVVIDRPTQIRTEFDRLYNKGITVVFIGQNGGYSDIADLVWQNRKMLEHSGADKFIVLGLSSGSAALRANYETAMKEEFGRRFVSLREYLASPIYDTDGTTLISCYGLDDAGLTPVQADLDAIATGTVPPQCLSDAVHYTSATKTVIGEMLFKRMTELNYFN